MKDKKIRKRVRFDFYKEERVKNNEENFWTFEKIFNYYIKNEDLKTNLNIGNEEIEIEPKSLFKDDSLYFFLISNLRNEFLPAKKKIGQEKTDIKLDDDEYIGEFTGVVYDSTSKIFMIQINKYGIGPMKIEEYLKALKDQYISLDKEEEIVNTDFSLNMILNPNELETVADSKEIRSIHFKSSRSSLYKLKKLANEKEAGSIKQIDDIVSSYGNVNFEITISANFEKEEYLDKESSKNFINLIKKFLKKDKKELSFSITRRKDSDSNVDTIDFLLPKMIKYITLSAKPKESIGRDYLRKEMFKGYLEIKDKLMNISE